MARYLTVTANPAVDLTFTVDKQGIGETIRVAQARRMPGGKGVNVARVLSTLGKEVAAVLPLGGHLGAWMEDELARTGVPSVVCRVSGAPRTTVAIVDGIAHPSLYAEAGPELSAGEWTELASAVRDNAATDGWVVIAGSFPPGTTTGHVAQLIDAAHAAGARVVIDTSGPLLAAAAEAGADIVKANESEICAAADTLVLHDAMSTLAQRGAIVLMTRGADGAVLRMPDGTTYHQPAIPGLAGNPTGAGDAATAGLVAALHGTTDPGSALLSAVVCGAAAVLSDVAGVIDRDDLHALAARAPAGKRVSPDAFDTLERSSL